jgi:hypothetical protein
MTIENESAWDSAKPTGGNISDSTSPLRITPIVSSVQSTGTRNSLKIKPLLITNYNRLYWDGYSVICANGYPHNGSGVCSTLRRKLTRAVETGEFGRVEILRPPSPYHRFADLLEDAKAKIIAQFLRQQRRRRRAL